MYVVECEDGLVGNVLALMDELLRNGAQVFQCGLEFLLALWEHFGCGHHMAFQVGTSTGDAGELAPSETLHDDGHAIGVSWHFEHPDDACIDAILEKVVEAWVLHRRIALAENGEQSVGMLVQHVDEPEARRAANQNGRHHAREHNQVAGSQNGQFAFNATLKELLNVAVVVGYH